MHRDSRHVSGILVARRQEGAAAASMSNGDKRGGFMKATLQQVLGHRKRVVRRRRDIRDDAHALPVGMGNRVDRALVGYHGIKMVAKAIRADGVGSSPGPLALITVARFIACIV